MARPRLLAEQSAAKAADQRATTPAAPAIPRWPWVAGLALSLVGFGVAAYLTYEHYTGSRSLSCPAGGGKINCFAVTTSIYSKIHGVPVANLGLVFFVVMAVLQSPPAWRSHIVAVRAGRIAWSLLGVGTAVWLIYAELFKIDAICLWCTSVHAISLVIFVVTIFGTLTTSAHSSPEQP